MLIPRNKPGTGKENPPWHNEEGQLFSWSAVFSPYISTAWVMATCPTKVLAIDAKKLNLEFEKNCEFGFKTMSKIAQTISHRLSDTRFQLMNH